MAQALFKSSDMHLTFLIFVHSARWIKHHLDNKIYGQLSKSFRSAVIYHITQYPVEQSSSGVLRLV